MTIEEAIEYWEQFDAEIDELASDNLYEEQIDALEKQREVVEFTISALRAQKSSCCKKCNDLYDEDGGDIYPPQKERNDLLTLDNLRGNCSGCVNEEHKEMCIGCIRHSLKFNGDLYRQKPEEGDNARFEAVPFCGGKPKLKYNYVAQKKKQWSVQCSG